MIRQEDPDQVTTTATAGRALRRAALWVVLGALAVVSSILIISSVGGGLDGGIPLAADNPAPQGAMAVAEVLRQQGVDVVPTASLDATLEAVASADDATVLLWDDDLPARHRAARRPATRPPTTWSCCGPRSSNSTTSPPASPRPATCPTPSTPTAT